jgi:hypothetical protein
MTDDKLRELIGLLEKANQKFDSAAVTAETAKGQERDRRAAFKRLVDQVIRPSLDRVASTIKGRRHDATVTVGEGSRPNSGPQSLEAMLTFRFAGPDGRESWLRFSNYIGEHIEAESHYRGPAGRGEGTGKSWQGLTVSTITADTVENIAVEFVKLVLREHGVT